MVPAFSLNSGCLVILSHGREVYVKRLYPNSGWELILEWELRHVHLAGSASASQLGGFLVEVTLPNEPARE